MMSVHDVARVLDAHDTLLPNTLRFDGVATDSRVLGPGQLFVALRGERFDGHDFLAAAASAGAAAALVDARWYADNPAPPLPVVVVHDSRLALGTLAGAWRARFALPLIGVTGSNGKTTVKEMCSAILRAQAHHEGFGDESVLATRGNLNNDIGMPLTLLELRDFHRAAVIEMGMNHPGAAIAAEIEKAAAKARAEKEQELQQAQAEAAELGAAGEALEAERDELAEQVAVLTTERDTLAGKAAQQAADLADAQQRIEREQQAAEAARVEVATARLKIEAQTERQTEQAAEIERLRAALAEAQQGRTAAEQQAAVLAAKLEACADRVSRAEARAEQIEQQAATAAQAHDTARAAAVQETRQAQAAGVFAGGALQTRQRQGLSQG